MSFHSRKVFGKVRIPQGDSPEGIIMAKKKEKPFNNPLVRRRRMRGGAGKPNDERPLTTIELAEAIGYSAGHYSEVENGMARAGDNMVEALSRFYDVDMETIRDEADAVFDHRQSK